MFKDAWVDLLRPLRSGRLALALVVLSSGFAAATVAFADAPEPESTVPTAPATTATTTATEAQGATTTEAAPASTEPSSVSTEPITSSAPVAPTAPPAPPATSTEPDRPEANETEPSRPAPDAEAPATPAPAAFSVAADGPGPDLATRSHDGDALAISGTGQAGTGHLCVPRWERHGGHRHPIIVSWQIAGGAFDAGITHLLPSSVSFSPRALHAGKWLSCSITLHGHGGPPRTLHSRAIRITSLPFFFGHGDVSIAGDGRVGAPITCRAPRIGGFPEPAVKYVWVTLGRHDHYRPVASGPVFTPGPGDAGASLTCGVRISNPLGRTTRFSRVMLRVSGPPINVEPPAVTLENAGSDDQALTCDAGSWDQQGEPIESYQYGWQRDGADVEAAAAATLAPTAGGAYTCVVRATNARGQSEPAVSAPVQVTVAAAAEATSDYATPAPPPTPAPARRTPRQQETTPVAVVPQSAPPEPPPVAEPAAKKKRKRSREAPAPVSAPAAPAAVADDGLRDSPYGRVNDDRSYVATSLARPGDLDLNGKKAVTGSLLAILMVALLGLPVAVFNETTERHHAVIADWLAGPRRLLEKLFGWVPFAGTSAGALTASVLISTAIFAFLSPGFPSAPGSWEFLAGMLTGLGVVAFVFFATWHIYISRCVPESAGHWRLYPLFAVIAGVAVIVSRVAHFVPGVILGTIAEYEPSRPLTPVQRGQRVALAFGAMLLLSLACWLAWIPVSDQANQVGCSSWWLILDAALAVGFITGLETTVFGLIPMRFLDGHDLLRWNRVLWGAMWGIGLLWFSLVIVDPAVSGYGEHADTELSKLVVLLGVVSLIAAATWTIFYRRQRREAVYAAFSEHE